MLAVFRVAVWLSVIDFDADNAHLVPKETNLDQRKRG